MEVVGKEGDVSIIDDDFFAVVRHPWLEYPVGSVARRPRVAAGLELDGGIDRDQAFVIAGLVVTEIITDQ